MLYRKLVACSVSFALLAGCTSGISSRQKMELDTYESRGIAVHEKTPAAGALLGILPGFGSFYGRAYGVGVVNLIFWPLSICWDPVSGYRASDRINYAATKQHVATLRNKELNDLNTKRASGLVDDNFYKMGLYDISQKYDIEPMAMPIISGPISNTGTNK